MLGPFKNHDFDLPMDEARKILAIGGVQKKRWRYPECTDVEYATVSLTCRQTEVIRDVYHHDRLLNVVNDPAALQLACGPARSVTKIGTTLTYEPKDNKEFFWRGEIIIPHFQDADRETYQAIWRAAVPGEGHGPHLLSSRRLSDIDDCLRGLRPAQIESRWILVWKWIVLLVNV
ncbi:MAG: hypothetical protein V2A73_00090 [Pseudomonadota bacterium]